MKTGDIALIVLIGLLVVFLALYIWVPGPRGVALQPTTPIPSFVQIDQNIAYIPSPNLLTGVDFGLVAGAALPVSDVPSTNNADVVGGSSLFIQRDISSTVDLKVCIHADKALEEPVSLSTIPLIGETYSFSLTTTPPVPPGDTSLTLPPPSIPTILLLTAGAGVDTVYYRFWLDIPTPGLDAGTYSNQITFSVVEQSLACP